MLYATLFPKEPEKYTHTPSHRFLLAYYFYKARPSNMILFAMCAMPQCVYTLRFLTAI